MGFCMVYLPKTAVEQDQGHTKQKAIYVRMA